MSNNKRYKYTFDLIIYGEESIIEAEGNGKRHNKKKIKELMKEIRKHAISQFGKKSVSSIKFKSVKEIPFEIKTGLSVEVIAKEDREEEV